MNDLERKFSKKFVKFSKKTKIYFKSLAKKPVYVNGFPKKDLEKNFISDFFVKIWFFENLCYGCYRNWFSRHSPHESRGHCASENIGAANVGKFCLRCLPRPVCIRNKLAYLGFIFHRKTTYRIIQVSMIIKIYP